MEITSVSQTVLWNHSIIMFKSRGDIVYKCTVRLLEDTEILECEFHVSSLLVFHERFVNLGTSRINAFQELNILCQKIRFRNTYIVYRIAAEFIF